MVRHVPFRESRARTLGVATYWPSAPAQALFSLSSFKDAWCFTILKESTVVLSIIILLEIQLLDFIALQQVTFW